MLDKYNDISYFLLLQNGRPWLMVDRQKIETNIAHNFFCSLALTDNNYLIFTVVDEKNWTVLLLQRCWKIRASLYEPGWPGWPGYRDDFRLGFIWKNFSPVSGKKKGQRSWGRVLAPNLGNKANMEKHKIFYFRGSVTLKAVSLQLNGMLMMCKIQQAMQDNAIRTVRIIPVTGMKCSYGKIFSPLTEISGTEPARPLIWTCLLYTSPSPRD